MLIDYPNSVDIQEVNDEIWFDIINRTITLKEGYSQEDILVQNDANSRNFGFMIQRHFELTDLSEKKIRIHYVNSLGEHDYEYAHSIQVVGTNEDVLSFQWKVGSKVCLEIGNVEFAVEFYDDDGYALFTTPMMITISKSVCTFGNIPEPSGGWYEDLIRQCEISFPKSTIITLSVQNWTNTNSPYSQIIAMNGVSATSKVDLQPTPEQLIYFQDQEISLVTLNDNGIVTVYAIGAKPTIDLTMQVIITEVVTV